MRPFAPLEDCKNIAVSATTQRISLGQPDHVRVTNDGSATVWVRFGGPDVESSTSTGFPMTAGMTEVFSFPASLASGGTSVNVAVIAAAATGTVYFQTGVGI